MQSSESSGGNLRYNHHVRLLSRAYGRFEQPQFTRVKEPTLLCNQVPITDLAKDDFRL